MQFISRLTNMKRKNMSIDSFYASSSKTPAEPEHVTTNLNPDPMPVTVLSTIPAPTNVLSTIIVCLALIQQTYS